MSESRRLSPTEASKSRRVCRGEQLRGPLAFSLHVHGAARFTVVEVSGEIDASNFNQFRTFVAEPLNAQHNFVVDLSGVDFIDLSGVRTLLGIDEHCRRIGLAWMLVPGDAVKHLLRLLDYGRVLPTIGSVDAAVERLALIDASHNRS